MGYLVYVEVVYVFYVVLRGWVVVFFIVIVFFYFCCLFWVVLGVSGDFFFGVKGVIVGRKVSRMISRVEVGCDCFNVGFGVIVV